MSNVYSATGLARACVLRRHEQTVLPLGTDRVMNDLMRLDRKVEEIDQNLVEAETVDSDIEVLTERVDNLQRELEDLS